MSTPAGWYPDAEVTGGERWWDGTRWSYQRRPAATYAGPDRLVADRIRWGKGLAGLAVAAVGAAVYYFLTGGTEVDGADLARDISNSIETHGGPSLDLTCDNPGRVSRGDVTFCRGDGVLIRVTFNSDGRYAYETVD